MYGHGVPCPGAKPAFLAITIITLPMYGHGVPCPGGISVMPIIGHQPKMIDITVY
jgi:hypothetical protein